MCLTLMASMRFLWFSHTKVQYSQTLSSVIILKAHNNTQASITFFTSLKVYNSLCCEWNRYDAAITFTLVDNAAGFQKVDLYHALWLIEQVVTIMWLDYRTHVSLIVLYTCLFHSISNFQFLEDVCIIIFMVYYTNMSVAVSDSWRGFGIKWSWSNLRYCHGIFMERLRETIKKTWCPITIQTDHLQNMSLEMLPLLQTCSVGFVLVKI
jgi:hypothetical protein